MPVYAKEARSQGVREMVLLTAAGCRKLDPCREDEPESCLRFCDPPNTAGIWLAALVCDALPQYPIDSSVVWEYFPALPIFDPIATFKK